ncbi:MAG TPA: dihydropteroate synthase [Candidatus Acidoferrum sp.]|nr:dihydropteroate synthase [Candidatus Acidoferrum sp.]
MINFITLSADRRPSLSRPLIMGILNVTPDSFSDGGKFARFEAAVAQAMQMQNEGADIIDIGGESSRPGAEPVSAQDEMERVLPAIKEIRRLSPIQISIDTYKAATAEAALAAGANIVNDISALRFDPAMVDLLARTDVPVILMHMLGTPRDMQQNPTYTDCVKEIGDFFGERIEFCRSRGIGKERLILDPGIGFGKRLEDNLAILRELEQFKRFGLPVLVGASRKSFIGKVASSERPAGERLGGSIAAAVVAALHGADIVRVHDVAETVEALRVVQAIREL